MNNRQFIFQWFQTAKSLQLVHVKALPGATERNWPLRYACRIKATRANFSSLCPTFPAYKTNSHRAVPGSREVATKKSFFLSHPEE